MAKLIVGNGALRFDADGGFTLKSGAKSSFFLDFGAILGSHFATLGALFGQAVLSDWHDTPAQPDVLFGPAYKGIPLAIASGVWIHHHSEVKEWAPEVCHDRKEVKGHGEGGELVGASLEGRKVLVIDDVLTKGTAARIAIQRVKDNGGEPVGLLVALARTPGVAEELEEELGILVRPLLQMEDLLGWVNQVVGAQHKAERASRMAAEALRRVAAARAGKEKSAAAEVEREEKRAHKRRMMADARREVVNKHGKQTVEHAGWLLPFTEVIRRELEAA